MVLDWKMGRIRVELQKMCYTAHTKSGRVKAEEEAWIDRNTRNVDMKDWLALNGPKEEDKNYDA